MKIIIIPEDMRIVHHDDFVESEFPQYIDEPYFRLYHDLQGISAPLISERFYSCSISLGEYADHINKCYNGHCVSESELRSYTVRPVYNADLWIAVKDKQNDAIAATGIAELDPETGEGILEWIQVSADYRRSGLGSYIVSELLWRMRRIAAFGTVSGKCNHPDKPELLYRKCGFTGNDVWHILKKRT